MVYIYIKIHEISDCIVMVNYMELNKIKDCNSCTTKASLFVHQRVEEMHIKVHEIPVSGYLVMAPVGRTEGQTESDGYGQNNIPPPSAGG